MPAGVAHAADFAITSHHDGEFVSGNQVKLSGTTSADTQVEVTATGSPSCHATVAGSTWSCDLLVPNGSVTVTATETPRAGAAGAANAAGPTGPDSSTSAPAPAPAPAPSSSPSPPPTGTAVSITLHVLGAPTISGSDPILTSGLIGGIAYPTAGIALHYTPTSGGASVAVDCPAARTDATWWCLLPSAPGDYQVTATQYDPGTPSDRSPPSTPAHVIVDRTPPTAPTITSPGDGATTSGPPVTIAGTGTDGDGIRVYLDGTQLCAATVTGSSWSCAAYNITAGTHVLQAIQVDAAGNYSLLSAKITATVPAAATTPVTPPGSGASPPASGGAPTAAPAPGPTAPGSAPPTSALPIAPTRADGTGIPSALGGTLPTVASTVAEDSWWFGLALALAFVVLVALPLRLAAGALGGRIALPHPHILGRNSRRRDPEATPRERMLALGVYLAVSAFLALLAVGFDGGVTGAQLFVSLAIGLVVLTGAMLLVGRAVARSLEARVAVRLVPGFLLIAALSAVASHSLHLHPPLLFGLVATLVVAEDAAVAARGRVQFAQVALLVALSAAAWLGHEIVPGASGFWSATIGETLATVCVSGLSAAVVLLLPVGGLPGRAIFAWSWPVWLGLTLVTVTLAGAVLISGIGMSVWLAVAGGFIAAACLVTWIWARWMEPALQA
jgi:hypothetical protein